MALVRDTSERLERRTHRSGRHRRNNWHLGYTCHLSLSDASSTMGQDRSEVNGRASWLAPRLGTTDQAQPIHPLVLLFRPAGSDLGDSRR
jgi:hypothetical protein